MPAENETHCAQCALSLIATDRLCDLHREPPRDEEPLIDDEFMEAIGVPCKCKLCRPPAPTDARDVIAEATTRSICGMKGMTMLPGLTHGERLESADDLLAALHFAGFSVVSREPTDEMIERACIAMTNGGYSDAPDEEQEAWRHDLDRALRAALSEGDER